jgi:hypothetical protein
VDRFVPGPECVRVSPHDRRAEYRPRRPDQTPLYQVVQEQLETLLERVHRERVMPLPKYVEQELLEYLKCGIYAHGFSVLRCSRCSEQLLVAFSCKGRTVCPSCGARRMCNQAANLVDCVLPNVPYRQWTLVVPYELRYAMAARSDVLRAVVAIFHSEVFRFQRREARRLGESRVHAGAVLGIQRMGGSLNLHVHAHALFFDGVFVQRDERLVFVRLEPPRPAELEHIARRVLERTLRWLRRARLLRDERGESESTDTELCAHETCQRLAMRLGRLARVNDKGNAELVARGNTLFEAPSGKKLSASYQGMNLEAGVVIEQHNRGALERLCRYILRPTVSLERMRTTLTGQITYKLKYPRKGATHLVLDPLEFLGRVAGLIAPPRLVHLRYAGVLAPHHRLRSEIVKLAVPVARAPSSAHPLRAANQQKKPKRLPNASRLVHAPKAHRAPSVPDARVLTAIGHGIVPIGPYIPWADLLKRTYSFDVLSCPCGGTRRVVEFVTDPEAVRITLEPLGIPTCPPPIPSARDPAWEQSPILSIDV